MESPGCSDLVIIAPTKQEATTAWSVNHLNDASLLLHRDFDEPDSREELRRDERVQVGVQQQDGRDR
jgi:hypothetical protein